MWLVQNHLTKSCGLCVLMPLAQKKLQSFIVAQPAALAVAGF